MSLRVMATVWDGFPAGGSELLALLALADWADDEGNCWPSMTAIARKTRLSRSQSQRVVHKLIVDGFLELTGNETGGAPGSTRQYRIILSSLTGRMGATGSTSATGRTDAAEGPHGCGETGRIHDTQYVSYPSLTISPSAPDGFAEFWAAYPRKVGKGAAAKVWAKLAPPLATVMCALEWQRRSDQWTRDAGRFIPHPATWLNQTRWMDEPPSAQGSHAASPWLEGLAL